MLNLGYAIAFKMSEMQELSKLSGYILPGGLLNRIREDVQVCSLTIHPAKMPFKIIRIIA